MPIRKSLWNRLLLSALASAFALLFATAAGAEQPVRVAQAQEPPPPSEEPEAPAPGPPPGIEEIVVRGAESKAIQDFSAADSVTAFSAADLVALGAASIADLAAFTPNLEIVTAGATTPTFFIRGVGLNDFGANATSAVAIYQDDVPKNSQALQLATLFDMENVNILRGPQGTGLARNSSAGAIKLYPRKPTGQFNGYLQGEFGNFNAREYEGAVEAPIYEDLLAGRFAFKFIERDGTMRNRCGSAPPFEARAPRLFFNDLQATHTTETYSLQEPVRFFPPGHARAGEPVPPWSICGENVVQRAMGGQPVGISDIPVGLPDYVNDRNNWAGRGTLLFEPTLDTSFLLSGHGSRRNELTRLGQSYGTGGLFQCLDGDLANCNQDFPAGSRLTNALGGEQFSGGRYQPIEVKEDLTAFAPCYEFGFGKVECQNFGPGPGPSPTFVEFQQALQRVGRDLARDLDDEPWKGDFNRVGKTRNDTFGAVLKSEILLPGDLELTTVGGYDRYFRKIDIDLDFSPETLAHVLTRDDGWQVYQDLKLAGETEIVRDSPVRWDVGGWVLSEKLDVNVEVRLPAGAQAAGVGERDYTQRLTSLAGYGSFSFDFWDDFTLDGGVRYNWERRKIDYLLIEGRTMGIGGTEFPLNEFDVWQAPTGTLRLTYRFREDTHAYWKYNRGWKPGHYNATGSRRSGITIAEPEFIDAFETGLRAEWFGGVIGADISLFYYKYQDYQIFTAQQFANTAPEFVVINANDAEVYGAEIDALLRPWDGGYVNVRFGWLETQFLDFVLVQQRTGSQPGVGQVVFEREIQNSGNPLLNSPRFKVSITAEQAIPLGKYGYLIPRYDGAWTDDTFYDPTEGRGIPSVQGPHFFPKLTIAQRAFWLHGARLAYRTPDGRVEIAGWVRNIENKAYKTFGFDGATFLATTIYFVGDPRTYGLTMTVTF